MQNKEIFVTFVGLTILGAVLVFVFISLTILPFLRELAWQTKYNPNIEKALEVTIGTPYVNGKEVLQFHVKGNGYAYRQGLRDKDVFTASVNFARSIYANQKSSFTFTVLRNGEEVEIKFMDIPEIGSECLKPPIFQLDDAKSLQWVVEKLGGC